MLSIIVDNAVMVTNKQGSAAMSKYHAGKNHIPLCGTRGTGNRFHVVTLSPKEWNALAPTRRCEKCAAAIKKNKRFIEERS